MKVGYLSLLTIATIASVTLAIQSSQDADLWKEINITESDIDVYKFDLPPLQEPNCFYFVFGVKGTDDVVITLSPVNAITSDIIEIIIGAMGNFFTCIRKGEGTKPVVDHISLDIITGEWQYFWIRFEDGVLSLGNDGEDDPFVEYYDAEPFKVKFVGVKSINAVSLWKFFLPGFGNHVYYQEIGESGGQYFNFPNFPSCKFYFEFCVKANGNVLLTLSPTDKIVNDVYQIMVGAMDNFFTCIVKYNGTKPVVDVTTLDILSEDECKYFWVRFEDGKLEIGVFGEATPIGSFSDVDPLEVSHIGVASAAASHWEIYLPCSYDPHLISVTTPNEYVFSLPELPEPQDCFYLRFGIFAKEAAVITFSPENGITENIYEIIFGAAGNIVTCIRKGKDTTPVVDIVTVDILEDCWQYFWIQYTNGLIEVGVDGSDIPLDSYEDPAPFPIRYVGVTSLTYESRWKFFTNTFGRREVSSYVENAGEYNFNFPKLPSNGFYFKFGIQAQSDAVLTLSPSNDAVDEIYQIIVGAEKNFFTCIIKTKGTVPIVDVFADYELSECGYLYFWVRFYDGLLEIGHYGCYTPIATLTDVSPYDVSYIGVTSFVSESWWKLYLPCDASAYPVTSSTSPTEQPTTTASASSTTPIFTDPPTTTPSPTTTSAPASTNPVTPSTSTTGQPATTVSTTYTSPTTPITEPPTTTPSPTTTSAPGSTYTSGAYYEAFGQCVSECANLVDIESIEAHQFVREKLNEIEAYLTDYYLTTSEGTTTGTPQTTTPTPDDTTTGGSTATTTDETCEADWIKFGNKCYRIYADGADSYNGAAGLCYSECAGLPDIESAEENEFLKLELNKVATFLEGFYLKATDLENEGTFVFSDNHYFVSSTEYVGYWNFYPGLPSNEYPDDNCLVSRVVDYGCWLDLGCYTPGVVHVICERDANTPCPVVDPQGAV